MNTKTPVVWDFSSVDAKIQEVLENFPKESSTMRDRLSGYFCPFCDVSLLMPKQGDSGSREKPGPGSYSFYITSKKLYAVEVIFFQNGQIMFCFYAVDKKGELIFARCGNGPHQFVVSSEKELNDCLKRIENYLVTGVC